MHHHKPCPHDGTPRIAVLHRRRQTWEIRCPKCHCRWDLQGTVLYFGSRYPWYSGTGGKPKPQRRKARAIDSGEQLPMFPLTAITKSDAA